jgi:thiol-disulfide isomerase/thioredoxin
LVIAAGLWAVAAGVNGAAQANGEVQQKPGEAVQQEIQSAEALLARRQYAQAIQELEHANQREHNACARCDLLLSESYRQLHDYGHAAASAEAALANAGGDRFLAAEAHNLKGQALASEVRLGDEKDKRLEQAEREFRAALALTTALPVAHYNLGVTLLREERDAEGAREIQAYLKNPVPPDYVPEARRMFADPRRAREPFAPDFSLTAFDGERISSEALRGKVVLLDFWGTWCHACLAAEPAIARVYKKYSGRPFELLAISSDTDEAAWRGYIAQHKIAWPEYRDDSHGILRAFSIYYYPTFIVIGPEGIIRYRSFGYSREEVAELEDAIGRALEPGASEGDQILFWWP